MILSFSRLNSYCILRVYVIRPRDSSFINNVSLGICCNFFFFFGFSVEAVFSDTASSVQLVRSRNKSLTRDPTTSARLLIKCRALSNRRPLVVCSAQKKLKYFWLTFISYNNNYYAKNNKREEWRHVFIPYSTARIVYRIIRYYNHWDLNRKKIILYFFSITPDIYCIIKNNRRVLYGNRLRPDIYSRLT